MKQIFVHVGPAKTGSSAIQNFCNSNQRFLADLGIMYPKHTLMESGVSAGNRDVIYDVSKSAKAKLSQKKIINLISDFKQGEASTLLLSSENFFGPMPELAKAIPEAKFIFYLRNPLSLAESLYNQDVKTLGKTEPFEIKTRRPDFGVLGHLRDFIKTYGTERLIIRYFSPECFYRGNIVNDIFDAMGIHCNKRIPPQQVNPSYTLEALETKRFLNNFIDDQYTDYLLNNLLQQYREGITNYSFLKPQDFDRHLKHVAEELEKFFTETPCEGSDLFMKTIKETQQKQPFDQSISLEKLAKVRNHIFSSNTPLYFRLCDRITSERTLAKDLQEKAKLFCVRYSPSRVVQLFYRLKFQAEKTAFINKQRAKKLIR